MSRASYFIFKIMPKNSILILLGIVEIIVLTLIGLYFFRLDKEEERTEGSFHEFDEELSHRV